MAPHPETGTPKGKETATKQTPTMEEQLQQWQTYASKLKDQVKEKETLLADKAVEVQTLQAVATGKKRTPKTPNPDPYHGDADKIEAFLMQLTLKITDNPDYDADTEKK